jgi:septal ring factor EnvC (AmiA/AmiB activator)
MRPGRVANLGLVLALGALSSFAAAEPAAPRATLAQRLTTARGTLAAHRERQDTVQASLATLSQRRKDIEARLNADGRAFYRLSRGGLLPMASGIEGLLGHASRMERLERMLRAELAKLEQLDAEGESLRREVSQLGAKVSEAESAIASLQHSQAGLLQQQLSQSLGDSRGALPQPAGGERLAYGLSVVGGLARERFADQRGGLALPVSGPSSIQEASRPESGGPGLEFASTPGAAVRAVAAGRVAFSDRYGSYGQLVILDHGDRYYTVYGGFASVDVQVGDEVSKSARLGGADVAPMYFEVRRGTKTENARLWLGI